MNYAPHLAGYVGPIPGPRFDRTALQARARGVYREASVGGVDAGECDQFQITWPSDVDRFKASLDPFFDATNTGVGGCPGLPETERAAWKQFYADWKAFARRKTPPFGSSNERELACTFSRRLDGFREKIKKTCAIPGPEQIEGRRGTSSDTVDLVRWATIGVVAVGAIGLLVLYTPEIKAAIAAVRK
jgi:hypothetical protein